MFGEELFDGELAGSFVLVPGSGVDVSDSGLERKEGRERREGGKREMSSSFSFVSRRKATDLQSPSDGLNSLLIRHLVDAESKSWDVDAVVELEDERKEGGGKGSVGQLAVFVFLQLRPHRSERPRATEGAETSSP